MDLNNARDLKINDSHFSDVHGDQNIHHHVHSAQVDGQNNTAILHEDHRSMFNNRIISDNCSNMVIISQGQDCQVTLDAVDPSFLRNRRRTPQNPSSPLRNVDPFDAPTGEGQSDAGTAAVTSNASYNQSHNTMTISTPTPLPVGFIVSSPSKANNTGQMTIIGQGNNNQVYGSVGSATPTQPPPTPQKTPGMFSGPSQPSPPSFSGQYPGTEDKTAPALDPMTSNPPEIMASSACVAERRHNDSATTARLPTSSAQELYRQSLQVPSPTGSPKPNKRKNILWFFWHRFLSVFQGWKNSKEKTSRV